MTPTPYPYIPIHDTIKIDDESIDKLATAITEKLIEETTIERRLPTMLPANYDPGHDSTKGEPPCSAEPS